MSEKTWKTAGRNLTRHMANGDRYSKCFLLLGGGDIGCLQMRNFECDLLHILQIQRNCFTACLHPLRLEDDRISHDKAVHCGVPGQSGKYKKTTSIFRTGRETDAKKVQYVQK